MSGSTIVVLEDCRERMRWIREEFSGEADIVWTWKVADFVRMLTEHEVTLGCVIMDHDIPPPDSEEDDDQCVQNNSQDVNGKTGHDACKEMPLTSAPILVWSVNGVGRERMIRTLRERGMHAEPLPHLQVYYDKIAQFVRDSIASKDAVR